MKKSFCLKEQWNLQLQASILCRKLKKAEQPFKINEFKSVSSSTKNGWSPRSKIRENSNCAELTVAFPVNTQPHPLLHGSISVHSYASIFIPLYHSTECPWILFLLIANKIFLMLKYEMDFSLTYRNSCKPDCFIW